MAFYISEVLVKGEGSKGRYSIGIKIRCDLTFYQDFQFCYFYLKFSHLYSHIPLILNCCPLYVCCPVFFEFLNSINVSSTKSFFVQLIGDHFGQSGLPLLKPPYFWKTQQRHTISTATIMSAHYLGPTDSQSWTTFGYICNNTIRSYMYLF